MIGDDRDDHQTSGTADAHPVDLTSLGPDQVVVSTADPAVAVSEPAVKPDETIVTETTPVVAPKSKPEPKRSDPPAPTTSNDRAGPGWMSHILTGVLAMVCGLAGAWAFASFAPKDQEKPTGDDPSRQAKKDSSESQAKKQDDAPSSEGDDKLREQIRNLSTRFEALRQRVETLSMPRDMNSPDLTAVRVRVDEFSRSVDGIKELPGRFRAMETQLDRLVDEMKGRPNRPADPETKTPVAVSASPEPPPPAPPADPSPSDGDLAAGMALFKESKYPEAEAKFRELQRTRPEDARVWYFSALSVGLTTGQWDGEARTFVIQGADRERAGLPATSVIDSALAELNPKSGKDWLASYRSQLLKR